MNVEIWHWELGQICARTQTKSEEKRPKDLTRFSARIVAFAWRFLPARCNLICKPRCVGKMETLAMTCNSRFASGFPRLAGIFAGKMQKNSSGTPTSGSHNFFIQTLIHAKFRSLESRRRGLSVDMLHDPFWVSEGLQNYPKKMGQKTVHAQKSRRIRWRGCVVDKIATWQLQ